VRTLVIEFQDEAAYDLVAAYCRLEGKDLTQEILASGYNSLLHRSLIDHLQSVAADPQTDVERFLGADPSALVNSVYSVVALKKPIPPSFAAAMSSRASAAALAKDKASAKPAEAAA